MSAAQESEPPEFAWTELTPSQETVDCDLLIDPGFRMFLVQVKSDSPIGQDLHNDPLRVLRSQIDSLRSDESDKLGIPPLRDDVRAMVLRANAERSANPRHRTEVWIVIPGSTVAVGVQYKHANPDAPPEF